ncbi:hypothetical protein EV175_002870 [Coemansia sp. RSA 1933]|nr:hypothetical protein EV175_002870 [Coemansia sp. RSA 1933]
MDDEGPAFISFSGLPDEDIHEFVASVESLRKHFKWSNQVTFCYARTMLKGVARKIVQTAKPTAAAAVSSLSGSGGESNEQQKSKSLGDEAIDPNSWANLKSALTFEFSDQCQQDRALVQLLSLKQQTGESSSEYAQRFVSAVSALVAAHPLDSKLLAVHFASGLRSEKARWELLLRRLDTIDKAIAFVAPEQLYKIAKLTSLLSPPPAHPPSVSNVGELSPTSDSSSSFTASTMTTVVGTNIASTAINTATTVTTGARHSDTIDRTYSYGDDIDDNDDELLLDSNGSSSIRGYTANGASFSLDDDFEGNDGPQTPMPYLTSSGAPGLEESENGLWTPPRLPDARQRRNHRQSMTTYALTHSASISNLSNGRVSSPSHHHHNTWTPAAAVVARHARSITPNTYASGSVGSYAGHAHQYNERQDAYSHIYTSADDGMQQRMGVANDGGSETDDGLKSANELNSLADQLENLSTMLRVQSDSRRRRPRLCYRCRQKGHIASECPLPSDVVVPNLQMREKLGKVAIVTGGARGMGKRIAEVLVEKGAKVVIGDIREQGEQVAEELNKQSDDKVAAFQLCDLQNLNEISDLFDRAVAEFSVVDILVNNAGIRGTYVWCTTDFEDLSKTIDINLKAPIEGTRLAVQSFHKANRPGCVVNISSIFAVRSLELTAVYGATKAGIVAFTAASAPLAQETPPVRINSVAPLYVDTLMTTDGVPEDINKSLRIFGECTVDSVADEVVRCIEDESLAGDTIVMNSDGPGSLYQAEKAEWFGFTKYMRM